MSGWPGTVRGVSEAESQEIERALLFVADARARLEKAADALEKQGSAPELVSAVRDAASDLNQTHRSLTQASYYSLPAEAQTAAF